MDIMNSLMPIISSANPGMDATLYYMIMLIFAGILGVLSILIMLDMVFYFVSWIRNIL